MHGVLHCLRFFLFSLVCVLSAAKPAAAISCHLEMGGTQLLFNQVSLLEPGTKTAMSTITYGCSGVSAGMDALVCISMGPGQEGGYGMRYLNSGQNKLGFNLYKDAALSTVWGGVESGGSPTGIARVLRSPGNSGVTATIPVYGGISPASQVSLPAGWYDTGPIGNWPMRMDYMEIRPGTPASCSSPFTGVATSRFYIQAVVANDCRIDGTTPMDFGVVAGSITSPLQTQSTVTVTCNGTAYRVGLDNGQHAVNGQRRMRGSDGYVVYELYRDAARSQRWGNNLWYDAVGAVGTGLAQSLIVYGSVPRQTIKASGQYTDTIVVTVDY